MSNRGKVVDILAGCPGCQVPYYVQFKIYTSIISGEHTPEYKRYLHCGVCLGRDCNYTPDGKKFTLRPPNDRSSRRRSQGVNPLPF